MCLFLKGEHMKQWNLIEVSQAINSVPECIIQAITMYNEDCTTKQITVRINNSDNMLYIRGFRTDSIQPAKDNNNIEMIEVTTGYSDGAMPNDPDYMIVHAKVKAAIMRLGYSVVNSLDCYF